MVDIKAPKREVGVKHKINKLNSDDLRELIVTTMLDTSSTGRATVLYDTIIEKFIELFLQQGKNTKSSEYQGQYISLLRELNQVLFNYGLEALKVISKGNNVYVTVSRNPGATAFVSKNAGTAFGESKTSEFDAEIAKIKRLAGIEE